MLIPELAVNPLGSQIIEAFFTDEWASSNTIGYVIKLIVSCTYNDRSDPSQSLGEVNFRQFVRTLARFRKNSSTHPHEMCTINKKIECKVLKSN